MMIVPLGTPAKVLTLAVSKLIVPVADRPNSTAIDCPVVDPAKLIGPDPLSGILFTL
jgi:hypothetical protein